MKAHVPDYKNITIKYITTLLNSKPDNSFDIFATTRLSTPNNSTIQTCKCNVTRVLNVLNQMNHYVSFINWNKQKKKGFHFHFILAFHLILSKKKKKTDFTLPLHSFWVMKKKPCTPFDSWKRKARETLPSCLLQGGWQPWVSVDVSEEQLIHRGGEMRWRKLLGEEVVWEVHLRRQQSLCLRLS